MKGLVQSGVSWKKHFNDYYSYHTFNTCCCFLYDREKQFQLTGLKQKPEFICVFVVQRIEFIAPTAEHKKRHALQLTTTPNSGVKSIEQNTSISQGGKLSNWRPTNHKKPRSDFQNNSSCFLPSSTTKTEELAHKL